MNRGQDLIVVAGATGQQGGAVARALLKAGHTVRILTRKPRSEAAQELKRLGAEVVQADFDDDKSVQRALQGAWGAFAVQNTWEAGVEKEEAQGKRFAELAKQAGVQHYVYTSVASAHRRTGIPHFENKFRVEETVRRLGFPSYAILRPVFFMENWQGAWFKPGLDQGKLLIGLKPSTPLQMVAVEDIGRFGLLAFEDHARLNKAEIDIAGDSKSMPETAALLSRFLGRKVGFTPVPIEEVRKGSADYATMLEWFDRVGYDVNIPDLAKQYGIQPLTLEQWAAKQKWAVPAI